MTKELLIKSIEELKKQLAEVRSRIVEIEKDKLIKTEFVKVSDLKPVGDIEDEQENELILKKALQSRKLTNNKADLVLSNKTTIKHLENRKQFNKIKQFIDINNDSEIIISQKPESKVEQKPESKVEQKPESKVEQKLVKLSLVELKELAKEMKIPGYYKMKKEELLKIIEPKEEVKESKEEVKEPKEEVIEPKEEVIEPKEEVKESKEEVKEPKPIKRTLVELKELAKEMKIPGYYKMKKEELLKAIESF
jgi:hypothetical protein